MINHNYETINLDDNSVSDFHGTDTFLHCPHNCPINLTVVPGYSVSDVSDYLSSAIHSDSELEITHWEVFCDYCGYNAIIRDGDDTTELDNPIDYFLDAQDIYGDEI